MCCLIRVSVHGVVWYVFLDPHVCAWYGMVDGMLDPHVYTWYGMVDDMLDPCICAWYGMVMVCRVPVCLQGMVWLRVCYIRIGVFLDTCVCAGYGMVVVVRIAVIVVVLYALR